MNYQQEVRQNLLLGQPYPSYDKSQFKDKRSVKLWVLKLSKTVLQTDIPYFINNSDDSLQIFWGLFSFNLQYPLVNNLCTRRLYLYIEHQYVPVDRSCRSVKVVKQTHHMRMRQIYYYIKMECWQYENCDSSSLVQT